MNGVHIKEGMAFTALPPKLKWSFQLHKGSGVMFNTPTAPCWAHRVLQKFMLGIVWKRLEE